MPLVLVVAVAVVAILIGTVRGTGPDVSRVLDLFLQVLLVILVAVVVLFVLRQAGWVAR